MYSSNGAVLEAIGSVNYNILLDCNVGRRQVLRLHIDQLRSVTEEAVPKTEPLSILFDDFGLDSFEPQRSELPVRNSNQQAHEAVEDFANPDNKPTAIHVSEETMSRDEVRHLIRVGYPVG